MYVQKLPAQCELCVLDATPVHCSSSWYRDLIMATKQKTLVEVQSILSFYAVIVKTKQNVRIYLYRKIDTNECLNEYL